MRIGPKYKIARRLGAPVFEKTQTQKYALSLTRKEKSRGRSGKPKSEFGQELLEKQKARYTYGVGERQLRTYVDKAAKAKQPAATLFSLLERRLDNVLYRAGVAKTRAQARQAASHGHVMVNGKRVTIPSILLTKGDVVTLRPASASSPLFAEVSERMKEVSAPAWLVLAPDEKKITVEGEPTYSPQENVFDLGVVIEFYNR